MSLRYALLALLLDGEASGYDLAKRFDSSVSNFWHALPQQLYAELGRLEEEGLVSGEIIEQSGRPNKRVFSSTDAGRGALAEWLDEPVRQRSMKNELLVKMYASDLGPPEEAITIIESQIPSYREKLALYEEFERAMLHGRTEEEFLRTTRRAGPYLTVRRGQMLERENLVWAEWAIAALRTRIALRAAGARKR